MRANATSELSAFLDNLRQAMGAHAAGRSQWHAAYRRVFDGITANPPAASDLQPARQPACRHLDACYGVFDDAEPCVRKLGASFRAIEPRLRWTSESERQISASLAENYADALIVGPSGFAPSGTVEIGISVMAPQTVYPDHRHPPEELYIALSVGQWRQESGPWIEPGIGGLIHNPPNIIHAMRAGEAPFLAIWCLPLG